MVNSGFAERLALAMRDKGVTQTQFGASLGVSPSTISRWLAGSVPRKLIAVGIAQYLNVSLEWLRDGKGEKFYFSVFARADAPPLDALRKWDELTTSERERISSEIIQEQKRGFGLRVHVMRTALRLSVKEFSKRCGVTISYISRIEGGSRSNPSHKVVAAIVKAFPVMHVWLMYGRGPILEPKQHRRQGFDQKEVEILEELECKERENLLKNQGKSIRELVDMLRLSNKDLVDLIEASKSADAGSGMGDGVARMLTEALVQRLSTHGDGKPK